MSSLARSHGRRSARSRAIAHQTDLSKLRVAAREMIELSLEERGDRPIALLLGVAGWRRLIADADPYHRRIYLLGIECYPFNRVEPDAVIAVDEHELGVACSVVVQDAMEAACGGRLRT